LGASEPLFSRTSNLKNPAGPRAFASELSPDKTCDRRRLHPLSREYHDLSERQIVLTPLGLQRIEDELRELQTVRRHEVAEHIRQAKDLGDVAENPEYEDAKTEQAFLEGRIADLKVVLGNCTVIEDEDIPTDHVGLGSVVKVKDLEMDEDWEFTLVGSFEADPDEDRISNEAPIGEALFGHKVGDEVSIQVPAGDIRYQIVSIRRPAG
jgi:transcription elongation factor GreA